MEMSFGQKLTKNLYLARPGVYYFPEFSIMFDSVSAGLVLSQLLYWRNAMHSQEYYKTADELAWELGLGVRAVRNAIIKLNETGVLSTKRKGIPATNHFIFDTQRLVDMWQKRLSGMSEEERQERRKVMAKIASKGQSTTETTKDYTMNTPEKEILSSSVEKRTDTIQIKSDKPESINETLKRRFPDRFPNQD